MMNTKIERVNPEQIDETIMEEAGRLIAEGELVAFPTETVYGLGGDALHPEAARKIYAAKGRPSDNPLIVHIADFSDMNVLHVKFRRLPANWPVLSGRVPRR